MECQGCLSSIEKQDGGSEYKYEKAFCPPERVEGNPYLEYVHHLIFSCFHEFTVERSKKNGEDNYIKFEKLSTAYAKGGVHPGDVKPSLAKALNRILEVLTHLNDIFDTLLEALSDPSDQVVLLVLEVHACIAKDPQHFRKLVIFLLEKCCALIIRQHCVLFDAERVYRELSAILGESDQDVASTMMQVQDLIQDHDASSFGDVSLQGPSGTRGFREPSCS